MSEHRLREYFASTGPAVLTAVAPASEAFVPCPCSMFAGYAAGSPGFVAEVYRHARELAEAQVKAAARPFPPAFSLN